MKLKFLQLCVANQLLPRNIPTGSCRNCQPLQTELKQAVRVPRRDHWHGRHLGQGLQPRSVHLEERFLCYVPTHRDIVIPTKSVASSILYCSMDASKRVPWNNQHQPMFGMFSWRDRVRDFRQLRVSALCLASLKRNPDRLGILFGSLCAAILSPQQIVCPGGVDTPWHAYLLCCLRASC